MTKYDDEPDENWQGWGRTPTAAQISHIEDLCEDLGYDCKTIMPDTFEEASELIEEMRDELGWT